MRRAGCSPPGSAATKRLGLPDRLAHGGIDLSRGGARRGPARPGQGGSRTVWSNPAPTQGAVRGPEGPLGAAAVPAGDRSRRPNAATPARGRAVDSPRSGCTAVIGHTRLGRKPVPEARLAAKLPARARGERRSRHAGEGAHDRLDSEAGGGRRHRAFGPEADRQRGEQLGDIGVAAPWWRGRLGVIEVHQPRSPALPDQDAGPGEVASGNSSPTSPGPSSSSEWPATQRCTSNPPPLPYGSASTTPGVLTPAWPASRPRYASRSTSSGGDGDSPASRGAKAPWTSRRHAR